MQGRGRESCLTTTSAEPSDGLTGRLRATHPVREKSWSGGRDYISFSPPRVATQSFVANSLRVQIARRAFAHDPTECGARASARGADLLAVIPLQTPGNAISPSARQISAPHIFNHEMAREMQNHHKRVAATRIQGLTAMQKMDGSTPHEAKIRNASHATLM